MIGRAVRIDGPPLRFPRSPMSLHQPTRWWVQLLDATDVELSRLPDPALGAFAFRCRGAPRGVYGTGLQSLHPATEVWRAHGRLRGGQIGAASYVADDDFLLAELHLDETQCGGLRRTARDAYRRLVEYTESSGYPHLLKVWTYFSAINQGKGDDERYKQFCVGRSQGIGERWRLQEPAATVIGRKERDPRLSLFWLASVRRGEAIDNPRQTPPRLYPRQYGPEPPRFSRAMLLRAFQGDALLISGTAAVVGAESMHHGNLHMQFAETCRNLEVLLAEGALRLGATPVWGSGTALRVYVREESDLLEAEALVRQYFSRDVQAVVLSGDVCRRELLVEIEAIQQW